MTNQTSSPCLVFIKKLKVIDSDGEFEYFGIDSGNFIELYEN